MYSRIILRGQPLVKELTTFRSHETENIKEKIAKDRKVIPDPIDDRNRDRNRKYNINNLFSNPIIYFLLSKVKD